MPTCAYAADLKLLDILLANGLASSKAEARRLIEQKGVKLDGEVLSDPFAPLVRTGVLQVGKRHFIRLI
jgi:tyrosyl-tRNA synthetase